MASLQKNVASQNITFAFVNATSGAALTGATAAGKKSVDGAAQASVGGSFSELGNGQYLFSPSQTDTNGTSIGYLFTATNAIPVNLHFFTDTGLLTIDSTGAASVTSNAKKNTAGRITFIMTDSTTHARKSGLTVTSQRVLDGGALASTTNSPAEIGTTGIYTLVLAAADQNANELGYLMTATGADDRFIERLTQP